MTRKGHPVRGFDPAPASSPHASLSAWLENYVHKVIYCASDEERDEIVVASLVHALTRSAKADFPSYADRQRMQDMLVTQANLIAGSNPVWARRLMKVHHFL